MGAAELQNALAAQSVFERLFADDAFSAGKSPLATRVGAVYVEHTSHAGMLVSRSQWSGVGGAGAFLSPSGGSGGIWAVASTISKVVGVRRSTRRVYMKRVSLGVE